MKGSLYALLLALKEINVPIADGLSKKMHATKFVGAIYMLDEVLPIFIRAKSDLLEGKDGFCKYQVRDWKS